MGFFDIQNSPASQEFVPIREVRDGIVVLDDGSLRAVFLTSSINFALKSQNEQEAIITQFQGFLNTLDFSVQLYAQSRNLNIDPYLELLREQYKKEENQLLQTQIEEYIDFIRTFTEDADIMRKVFFVVIPYNRAIVNQDDGIIHSIRTSLGLIDEHTNEKTFEQARMQLQERIGIVEQGLVRTGVRVTQLETEETIELFYKLLNPGNLETKIESSSVGN